MLAPPVEVVPDVSWKSEIARFVQSGRDRLTVGAVRMMRHERVNDLVVKFLPWSKMAKDRRAIVTAIASLGSLIILAKMIRMVLAPEGGFIGKIKMKKDLPENYLPLLGKPPAFFGGKQVLADVTGEDPYGENRVELSRGKQYVFGTRLSQNVILLPYHFLDMKESYPDHVRAPAAVEGEEITIKALGHLVVTQFSKRFVFRGEGDYCFMFVSGFTFPCNDLRGKFPVGLLPDVVSGTFKRHRVSSSKSQMVAHKTRMMVYTTVGVETSTGDCGELLVDGEGNILAMHIASNKSLLGQQAVACAISRNDVDKAINAFRGEGFVTDPWVGDNLVPECTKLRPGVHEKSDAGWMIKQGF